MNDIEFLMIIKNIEWKKDLFENVIKSASLLSNKFLIVNNNSNDNSKKIIKELTKKYKLKLNYFEDSREDYDYLKYLYVNKISEKFIFTLDDDEVLTKSLIFEIKKIIKKDFYEIIFIKLKTYFLDKENTVSNMPRIFLKNKNIFSGKKELHNLFNSDKIKSNKKIYYSENIIKHYSFITIKQFIEKSNFYSEKEAKELYFKNQNISNYKLFLILIKESTFYFFYFLIKQKSYKSLESFLYSLNSFSRVRDKILYYIEIKNGKK